MKYIPTLALAACLTLGLAACGASPAGEGAVETDWTLQQMAAAVWEAGSQLGGTEILPGDELYENYLTAGYGLDAAGVADGAIWAAGGTSAQEVAVFQAAEGASSEEIAQTLQTYLEERTGAFTGYLPEEAALLEASQVVTRGDYVALLACSDPQAAREAFEACFSAPPPEPSEAAPTPSQEPLETDVSETPSSAARETPGPSAVPTPSPAATGTPRPSAAESASPASPTPAPTPVSTPEVRPAASPEPWSYQESRLLDAWDAGDWSALAAEDQAILEVCREVIETVVPADGSDYEKELAVHDWMLAHGSYDSNTLSQLPDFQENPNNDNPYGFLVDGKGICLGYTTTFQLLMDLLEIPCITVEGSAYHGTEEHAWNQVQLDGEWYCVDVTWDDPSTHGTVSERTAHRYFNVTSEFMQETDHQWDESLAPEAAGTAYAWQP